MNISPSVYEHAARLIDVTPWQASRDAETMYQAHAAAYRFYGHQPVMPGIDIYNLEAEAYGGRIDRPTGTGIPAITTPVCGSTRDLGQLAPFDPQHDGRIPMQITVAARLQQTFPEATVRVPVAGPFSIASNLVGFETLILECALNPDRVAESLHCLVPGQLAMAAAIRDVGLDVAFFESAACPPMLSPEAFRRIELPALQATLQGIAQIVGHPVPCIIGGNTRPILDAMLETGSRYLICPFETDQQAFLQQMAVHPDVDVRVNCDPRVLARGDLAEIRAEADRVIRLISNRPHTTFGTGALPYEADPQQVRRLMDYVQSVPGPS